MAIIVNVTTVNSLWLFLCNYNFQSRLSSFGRSTVSLWPLLWTYQNATSLGILDEFTKNFRNYGHIRTPSKIIVKSLYNLYKHNSHGTSHYQMTQTKWDATKSNNGMNRIYQIFLHLCNCSLWSICDVTSIWCFIMIVPIILHVALISVFSTLTFKFCVQKLSFSVYRLIYEYQEVALHTFPRNLY